MLKVKRNIQFTSQEYTGSLTVESCSVQRCDRPCLYKPVQRDTA